MCVNSISEGVECGGWRGERDVLSPAQHLAVHTAHQPRGVVLTVESPRLDKTLNTVHLMNALVFRLATVQNKTAL